MAVDSGIATGGFDRYRPDFTEHDRSSLERLKGHAQWKASAARLVAGRGVPCRV